MLWERIHAGSTLERFIIGIGRAGLPEIDLVSHSGTSAAGEFAYSLNQTDILPSHNECNQGKKIRMMIGPVCDA